MKSNLRRCATTFKSAPRIAALVQLCFTRVPDTRTDVFSVSDAPSPASKFQTLMRVYFTVCNRSSGKCGLERVHAERKSPASSACSDILNVRLYCAYLFFFPLRLSKELEGKFKIYFRRSFVV